MPTYTYVCPWTAGNKPFELNVKISDRNNVACPWCKRLAKRLIDAPGAVYAPTAKGGLAT